MKVRLRTEWLTQKECAALIEILRNTPGVKHAVLSPPTGVRMNRSMQASLSVIDIVLVIGGFAANKVLSKPLEDVGKGFSEEIDASKWGGRNIARFLKSIPQRPEPYVPRIAIHSVETDETLQKSRPEPPAKSF